MCVRGCASVCVDVRGRASVRDTYAKFKFTVYLHELLYRILFLKSLIQ